MSEYNFPYERIRQIKEQLAGGADGEDPEPKTEEIKEPKTEEVKDTKEDALLDKLKGKTISLDSVEEGEEGRSVQKEGERRLLGAFSHLNVQIHLLAEPDLKTLKTKSKFKGLFDLGVLSVNSANYIGEEFSILFKDKAKVYVETADYLIALKAEQRVEFRKKVFAKVTEAKWK